MTMRFLPLVTRFLRSVVAVSASAAARGYIAAIDHGSARIRAVENGDARSVVHALEGDLEHVDLRAFRDVDDGLEVGVINGAAAGAAGFSDLRGARAAETDAFWIGRGNPAVALGGYLRALERDVAVFRQRAVRGKLRVQQDDALAFVHLPRRSGDGLRRDCGRSGQQRQRGQSKGDGM